MTETYKVGSLVVDLFGANQPKHGQPESKLLPARPYLILCCDSSF
jgi:hypothetical protein